MIPFKAAALTLLLAALLASRAESQDQAARPNTGSAFALEALGGSLGSLAGMGVVALAWECNVEDLGCGIARTVSGGAVGAVGAAIGALFVARETGSTRSAGGAALGAVVGTGVGLGVHYLLNRESDRNLGDLVTIPIFMLSQGIFAALGSRLGGRD